MIDDLHGKLQRWADRGDPEGAMAVLDRVDARLVNGRMEAASQPTLLAGRRTRSGWVAVAAALAVVVIIGGTALGIWLFAGGGETDVVQQPSTTVSVTVPSTNTTVDFEGPTTVTSLPAVEDPSSWEYLYPEISDGVFQAVSGLERGQFVPDLTGELADGTPFDLAALQGKPTLLHFWWADVDYLGMAGWVLNWDLRGLASVHEEWGDRINLVSVAAWGSEADAAVVTETLEFPSTVVLRPQLDEWGLTNVAGEPSVGSHPLWVLVDAEGRAIDAFYAIYDTHQGENSAFPPLKRMLSQIRLTQLGVTAIPVSGGLTLLSAAVPLGTPIGVHPSVVFTLPGEGFEGGQVDCYDRFEGINLTSPSGGKLRIGTGDLENPIHTSETIDTIIETLRQVESFTIGPVTETIVGGIPAYQLDLSVNADTAYLGRYNWGFNYEDWPPLLRSGDRGRIWLIATGDPDLFVLASAPETEFDNLMESVEQIIASMTITPTSAINCG